MNAILDQIERESGLSMGNGDFSFRPGTHYPIFFTPTNRFAASSDVRGYILVKGDKEIVIKPGNQADEIRQVLNFLKPSIDYVQES